MGPGRAARWPTGRHRPGVARLRLALLVLVVAVGAHLYAGITGPLRAAPASVSTAAPASATTASVSASDVSAADAASAAADPVSPAGPGWLGGRLGTAPPPVGHGRAVVPGAEMLVAPAGQSVTAMRPSVAPPARAGAAAPAAVTGCSACRGPPPAGRLPTAAACCAA